MRRRVREDKERPFFAAGRIKGFRRVIVRSVYRVMDERFIDQFVGRFIVRGE